MHHVRVGLDGHERVDLDRAVLAHPAEVVAPEVDEHDVLGALLLVGEQALGDPRVLGLVGAARARAGDRAGRHVAAGHGEQRLGARAGDLEVAEVQEVHVRARVDDPQPPVDRERVGVEVGAPALRGDDLEGVARVHVLDDPRDHRLELLARHVRGELGAGAGRRRRRRGRERAREQRLRLRDRLARGGVRGVDVGAAVLGVDVHEDRDRVLEVVEHDEHVGEHQRHVGQAEHVRVRVAEGLDGADEVVAEVADRATGERREIGQRRLPVAADLARGDPVRVALVAERPAHDGPRAHADERVAPDALALLGGLQQERGRLRLGPAQLEERGDRGLAVVDEGVADGDEVVVAGERPDLVAGSA